LRTDEREKQNGGARYEAGTRFMALDITAKLPVPKTSAAKTFGAGTITVK